jgi:hypothetical protein
MKITALFQGLHRRLAHKPAPHVKAATMRIPLDKLLLGGEWSWRANRYAHATGQLIRPSVLAIHGPHAQLLKDYVACGPRIFERPDFERTAYYRNARDCIRVFGEYFPYCWLPEQIVICARRFVLQYERKDIEHLPAAGHSPPGQNIRVFSVRDSDCFEIDEGNHRVAFAAMRGDASIQADIFDAPEYTPLQEMILRVAWQNGEREIYQPLNLPEIEKNWRLLRKSTDRLDRMLRFLNVHNLTSERSGKVLDIGAYYGWFVSELVKRGYDAYGIERDRAAIDIGKIVYRNIDGRIQWDDAGVALRETADKYGVVCCLSIMHHYILAKQDKISAIDLLQLLDKRTEKVLFFEMAEDHEIWFSKSLAGWSKDTIKNWVLEHSQFKEGYELGRDDDSVGPYRGNFGRMLFAFTR